MKKMQILGMDPDSICIIADMLKEMNISEHLDVYINVEFDKIPRMQVSSFSYKLYSSNCSPKSTKPVLFGTSGPKNKFTIFNFYKELYNIKEQQYLTLVYPSSYVASSVEISNGVLIEPNVAISSQTSIDFGVVIKRSCSIGHHIKIGSFTDLNPGVVIGSNVNIGKGCILGAGSVIRDNISIGDNSYIGMGSVVTKDVPPNTIAHGNPCKVIRNNNIWEI